MLQNKLHIASIVAGLLILVGLLFSMLHTAVVGWDLFIGMVGACFFSLVAIILATRRSSVATLLIVGFILRLGVAILYTIYITDADPDGYGSTALQMLEQGPAGLLQDIPLGAYFYSWLVAWVWMIFGESYFLIRGINAFLSFLTLVIFYDLSRKLFSSDIAEKLLVAAVFFPALIRFSGLFASREAISVLFLVLISYLAYRLYSTQKMRYLLGALASLVVASILHTGFFVYGIILVGAILFVKFRKGRKAFMLIPAFVVTIAIGVWMFTNGIGTEKLSSADGTVDASKIVALQDGSTASGRAAYMTEASPTGITESIASLPVRLVHFMYAPFPWMVRGVLDVVGFLDAISYVALTWYILKARKRRMFNDPNKQFFSAMTIALVVTISGFAIGTSNYGTALRHRAKFVLPMVVLAGASLKTHERIRK